MFKILSLLSRLLSLVELAVTSWQNKKLRQEGRDQLLKEQHKQSEEVRKRAQEIDKSVLDADLDSLDQRMRKYRLPPTN